MTNHEAFLRTLKAGEINLMILEKVFGVQVNDTDLRAFHELDLRYFQDLRYTWNIVERMRSKYWIDILIHQNYYHVTFEDADPQTKNPIKARSIDQHLPKAICYAALTAINERETHGASVRSAL